MNDPLPTIPEPGSPAPENARAGQSEETQSIQSAIEKLADEETAVLPRLDGQAGTNTQEPAADSSSDHGDGSGLPDRNDRPEHSEHAPAEPKSRVSAWFFTFMCMNIPLIGWIYLLHLAFGKGRTDRREFARAYLFYKLLFLAISLAILAAVAMIAMDMLDQLLAYMQML